MVAIKTSRWQWSSPHGDVTPLWVLAPHDLSICLHVLGRIPPLRQAFALIPGRPDLGMIAEGDRVVLVNTASPEKYLPTIRELFDGGL